MGGSSRAALFRRRVGGTLGSLGGVGEKGPLGFPSLSEDCRRTARMRSPPSWRRLGAALARPPSCCLSFPRCSRLTPQPLARAGPALPSAQRVGPRCPKTPLSFPRPLAVGPLAPAGPPARGRGSLAFSSAPFLFVRPASAALVRETYGDGSSRSLLPGARATQLRLPSLATDRLGLASPDPRPRIASFRAGPTPGRLVARCLVASSNAGLPIRRFPTSSETANGLDSSLLRRPSPFWTWCRRRAVEPAARRVKPKSRSFRPGCLGSTLALGGADRAQSLQPRAVDPWFSGPR